MSDSEYEIILEDNTPITHNTLSLHYWYKKIFEFNWYQKYLRKYFLLSEEQVNDFEDWINESEDEDYPFTSEEQYIKDFYWEYYDAEDEEYQDLPYNSDPYND